MTKIEEKTRFTLMKMIEKVGYQIKMWGKMLKETEKIKKGIKMTPTKHSRSSI